jgi:hypothetical protein
VTTDLADWTDPLRRSVATPGEFASFFPNTSDDDLISNLMDGLGQAQLDGFLLAPTMYEVDEDGIVTPDLSRPQAALVVVYSTAQFLTAVMTNRKNKTKYAARGNEADTEQSASIITALLKQASDRIIYLRERQRLAGTASAFLMADLYLVKAIGYVNSGDLALAGEAWGQALDIGPFYGG